MKSWANFEIQTIFLKQTIKVKRKRIKWKKRNRNRKRKQKVKKQKQKQKKETKGKKRNRKKRKNYKKNRFKEPSRRFPKPGLARSGPARAPRSLASLQRRTDARGRHIGSAQNAGPGQWVIPRAGGQERLVGQTAIHLCEPRCTDRISPSRPATLLQWNDWSTIPKPIPTDQIAACL